MKQPFRLASGGTIDRSQELSFSFNGRACRGYAGDSLASALLANGIRVVARSFKYHRPRGIFSAGEEEPNALLEIGQGARREPTCRAPQVRLVEGLTVRSQSGWPSLGFDLGRVLDYTHALWPAGFYNKTFKWPSWHTWEGMVRRMSGLGRPLLEADPDRYEQVNAHCDVLVCGGGPAGLMSALVAARAGLRVILADQDEHFGGSLNWEQIELNGEPAGTWVAEVVAELHALPGVLLLPRTTVSGNYDHNVTTLVQRGNGNDWRECFWTVRPRRIMLATGAIEQGLVFANNDRPGIMLASAIRHYLNRYAVACGRQAVIATNNDTAYQTAVDLCTSGQPVKAIVDSRPHIAEALQQRMADLGISVFSGCRISDTKGSRGIRAVRLESVAGEPGGRLDCDLLGVSGGWAPRVHLFCHARGELRFDQLSQSFLPVLSPQGFVVAGAAAGRAELRDVLADAEADAIKMCADLGITAHHVRRPEITRAIIESRQVGDAGLRHAKRRQWIDLAHDVTFSDAELAVREGYDSVEHFKRYTTTGMSVDQGKTGNLNAFLALASLTGRTLDEIGTTTFRPPYTPTTLGAIAGSGLGDFYLPRRHLPAHRVHQMLEARCNDYGGWQRPDYYPQPGETPQQAIERETRAVRARVGVFDNSPIGKIEVRGPHAAEFLHRCYINNVHNLPVGRTRYGLMLNENGVIIDDGVFSRLADDRFLVNTTSGGVSRITAMFEEWLQCEWTDLAVLVDDVTARWANFTVAGPRARELLQKLGTDIDLSPAAMPHMSVRSGRLGGDRVRLLRVSFSGELSYEVNIKADHACSFVARLFSIGEEFGLTPYGIEALMLLRLEKAYLHVGSDTDGTTSPDDVGWGRVARHKEADYIGKRSLDRSANRDPQRKQLVGLLAVDASQEIQAGGHLLIGEHRRPPAATDGWITSAAWSPHLGRYVALAMLRGGQQRLGERLTVIDEGKAYHAEVVPTPFWDPANERLKQ
jgi:sarcosine oxidase subunit alpha